MTLFEKKIEGEWSEQITVSVTCEYMNIVTDRMFLVLYC